MNAHGAMQEFVLAARLHEPRSGGRSKGAMLRWGASFAVILGLHLGVLAYALAPTPDPAEGNPDDAINVELLPDPSDQSEKPDEVAGPEVQDSAVATSEQQTDDPDPPAPDAPPPTEVQKKPDTAAPELTAPTAPTESEAALPPPAETPPQDRPPDPTPPVEKPPEAKPDVQEQRTAPSQASTGSAALIGGGRRPSAAAQATWRGAIGVHLVHNRRYPAEARARGIQGVVKVKVTLDANGHVVGRDIVQSSGRPILDDEALTMMKRADPFPKPPPGMPAPIVLTVPVKFAIR